MKIEIKVSVVIPNDDIDELVNDFDNLYTRDEIIDYIEETFRVIIADFDISSEEILDTVRYIL